MLLWLFASVLIVVNVLGLGLTVRWLVGAPVIGTPSPAVLTQLIAPPPSRRGL